MSNSASNNFFDDFLEDYFAECEEHLTVVRRQLLAIEADVEKPQIEPSVLNELFRSFHSLKGLSGMVGVKEAEELAHEMESYLRVLRDGDRELSSQGFDALLEGTKLLEKIIAARRDRTSPPDISAIADRLRQIIGTTESPRQQQGAIAPLQFELKPEQIAQVEKAIASGQSVWHFIFAPSAERSARGIDVNKTRERLQAIGQILYAAPRMTPENRIEFDFLLATRDRDSGWTEWETDGLTWKPYRVSESDDRSAEETTELPTPPESEDEQPPEEPPELPAPPESETEATPTPSAKGEMASPPQTSSPGASLPAPLVVRVDLPKLDELMRMVGDLVITRAWLEDRLNGLKEILPPAQWRTLSQIDRRFERQLRDLREGIMRVRLVPIGEIFARMQFVVRDLVRSEQKQVKLEVSGEETEIDKFVVERMMDPLLHLVRNAVSHGIEPSSDRRERGKPAQGNIALRAKTAGDLVQIEIEDDGRGIDLEKVAARARERGLLLENSTPDPRENPYDAMTLLEILCAPGFSTRERADRASGRGVGMAIVKNTVQELGGMLNFESQPGRGTRFLIELPLTLAIADALIVAVAEETYAIPLCSVRETIAVAPESAIAFANNETIPYKGSILPLIRLANLFGLNRSETGKCDRNPTPQRQSLNGHSTKNLHVVAVGNGLTCIGIVVDRILGQREIVVRSLTDPLLQVPGITGATELGDGRAVLILDPAALGRYAMQLNAKHPL